MYKIELSQRAQKFVDSLDKHIADRVNIRLKNLENDPVPSDAKFIRRDELGKVFRYRIGFYRALYRVKEKEKIILIVELDKRPRVYER